MNSPATAQRTQARTQPAGQSPQQEPSLEQVVGAYAKSLNNDALAADLKAVVRGLEDSPQSKGLVAQLFGAAKDLLAGNAGIARDLASLSQRLGDVNIAVQLFDKAAEPFRELAKAKGLKDSAIGGADRPELRDLRKTRTEQIIPAFDEVSAKAREFGTTVVDVARNLGAGSPAVAQLNAIATRVEHVTNDAKADALREVHIYMSKQGHVEKGPAKAIVYELTDFTTAGPITLPATVITTSSGAEISMQISRDENGYVDLSLKGPALGRSTDPVEVKFRLDKESLIADSTKVGDDAQAEIARAAKVQGRILARVDEVLKAWESVDPNSNGNPKTAADGLARNSAWGLIDSAVGKALIRTGCKITELSNGEFAGTSRAPLYIGGLDLSQVKFHNFSISNVVAPGLDLRDSKWTGKYSVENNKLWNVNLDGSQFEGNSRCAFKNNDCHGPASSLRYVNFHGINAGGNNLLGAELAGMRADSITDRVGLFDRVKFRKQFGGTLFSGSKLDEGTKPMFTDLRVARGMKDGPDFRAKTAHPSVKEVMDLIEASPFINNSTGAVPAPATKKNEAGQRISVVSRDGDEEVTVFVARNLAYGYIEDRKIRGASVDSDEKASGTLDLLKRVMEVAQGNKRVEKDKGGATFGPAVSDSLEVLPWV